MTRLPDRPALKVTNQRQRRVAVHRRQEPVPLMLHWLFWIVPALPFNTMLPANGPPASPSLGRQFGGIRAIWLGN